MRNMDRYGYVKNVSVAIPAEQYETLKEISEMYALPINRLMKKGIGMVIEQYMEKGEVDKKTENEEQGNSQESSEC